MQNKGIVIDCDPGLDDLLALCAAAYFFPHRVKGICSTYGNTNVEQTLRNSLMALKILPQINCSIYRGAACADFSSINTKLKLNWQGYGDNDGLCGVQLTTLLEQSKVDLFKDFEAGKKSLTNLNPEIRDITELIVKLKEKKDGYDLISIAPLTDISALYRAMSNENFSIYTLGSYFNLCPVERARLSYNIKLDPNAANKVFTECPNLTITGLDIYGNWSEHDFFKLFNASTKINTVSSRLLRNSVFAYNCHKMDASALLVDSLPIFAIAHPELFTWTYGTIKVIAENYPNVDFMQFQVEEFISEIDKKTKAKVATGIDLSAFIDYWLEIICKI